MSPIRNQARHRWTEHDSRMTILHSKIDRIGHSTFVLPRSRTQCGEGLNLVNTLQLKAQTSPHNIKAVLSLDVVTQLRNIGDAHGLIVPVKIVIVGGETSSASFRWSIVNASLSDGKRHPLQSWFRLPVGLSGFSKWYARLCSRQLSLSQKVSIGIWGSEEAYACGM